ncbi:methyltransferase domain-containing protein [Roseomonas sp. CCTCC AB2023176]|uniref:methyltransferase domain-containing protein n=1 Tax=Roseomonas sp. CCTCC AB2023176 TaxID=3342640 RepID=UPI0035E27973
MLELGPGRLVTRAPAYAALGCGPVWFADVEDDAPGDPAAYARVADLARAAGLPAPSIAAARTREEALAACGARLLLGGTEVLAAIPDGSVDLVISDVVLEHVRRDALAGLLSELRRISSPEALGTHAVDFHDHVGGALNTLRFPPWFWDGGLGARSGLYVNRLGLSAIEAAFSAAGFATRPVEVRRWPAPPPGAAAAHPAIRRRAEDDLVAFARLEATPL